MPRYELPEDLSPQEERAVVAALDRVLSVQRGRPTAWALAGRAEALRLGSLRVRRDVDRPWTFRGNAPFVRRGSPRPSGHDDAK
jgi:hypothetical protein